jgi:hypothetical protein
VIPRALLRQAAARERTILPAVRTLPAPVGGWNARDSQDQMDEKDAIQLDNWFPGFGKVSVRKGFTSYATGVGAAAVETLAVFEGVASSKLIAASASALYNASSAGAAASLATGFTSGRWQTAMMNGVLGLVNGQDAPQIYDGATVGAMTVSGPTVANLIGINIFKSRSYFWTDNSASFWYSATSALGGSLTEFAIGEVFPEGGKIVAMVTWTRDGGAGMDDLAVFLMSAGYAIVYQGDDPGTADSWAMVGVFKTGSPLGVRAITKIGGDALIATRDGYALLSKLLPGGQGAPGITISDKIVNAVLDQARLTGTSFGWQALFYPAERMVIVNYPGQSTGVYQQHVVNAATGAWCRFKGMNGRAWAVFGGQLYFGGAGGVVYKALFGSNDNGADIQVEARQAYTYLGNRGLRKRLAMVRPVMEGSGTIPLDLNVDVDFGKRTSAAATVNFGSEANETPWGSPWGSPWSSGNQARSRWISRSALGYAFGLRMRASVANQSVAWNATGLAFQSAGIV